MTRATAVVIGLSSILNVLGPWGIQAPRAGEAVEPLYEDPSGWTINTELRLIHGKFQNWVSDKMAGSGFGKRAYEAAKDTGLMKMYEYCFANAPEEWWLFTVDLNRGDILYWEKDARLFIRLLADHDTLTFQSAEIKFTRDTQRFVESPPVALFASNETWDRSRNGIVGYARFPGIDRVGVKKVLSFRPEGVSLLRESSSR